MQRWAPHVLTLLIAAAALMLASPLFAAPQLGAMGLVSMPEGQWFAEVEIVEDSSGQTGRNVSIQVLSPQDYAPFGLVAHEALSRLQYSIYRRSGDNKAFLKIVSDLPLPTTAIDILLKLTSQQASETLVYRLENPGQQVGVRFLSGRMLLPILAASSNSAPAQAINTVGKASSLPALSLSTESQGQATAEAPAPQLSAARPPPASTAMAPSSSKASAALLPRAPAHKVTPAVITLSKEAASLAAKNRSAHALLGALSAWADAWTHQNLSAYFDVYGTDFRPTNGIDFITWQSDRGQRISTPKSIALQLQVHSIAVTGKTGKTTFHQTYRSDKARLQTLKTLDWMETGKGWKILAEDATP